MIVKKTNYSVAVTSDFIFTLGGKMQIGKEKKL
jgi:hypothetical protein